MNSIEISVKKPTHLALVCALAVIVTVSISACGGGGGGGNDPSTATVLQGVLLQGQAGESAEAARISTPRLAHSASEGIGEVEVCALGICSTTDDAGQWGFAVPSVPTEVAFTIVGHGINQTATVTLPADPSDVLIEFENNGSLGIEVHSVVADGQPIIQPVGHPGAAESDE